jgi:hypothetical protein
VLNRWVEHFTEIQDRVMISETDTRSEELVLSTEEVDMDVPTKLEINTAIAKLKNSKAPVMAVIN